VSEPVRLIHGSRSALARQLLASGTAERPSHRSFEDTLASIGVYRRPLNSGLPSRRVGRSQVRTRREHISFSWRLALLATAALVLGALGSYAWGPVEAPLQRPLQIDAP
jgi:hypothetical protein